MENFVDTYSITCGNISYTIIFIIISKGGCSMQIFCAWKWKKQYILYGIAAIALVIGGIHFLPPAAEQVSVILQAEAKKELPIYCVETDEKKVAISFDAAWGADDTDDLLSILDEYDVTATFFLCGYWVEKYPEEVEKIAEAGHDLGCYTSTYEPTIRRTNYKRVAAMSCRSKRINWN